VTQGKGENTMQENQNYHTTPINLRKQDRGFMFFELALAVKFDFSEVQCVIEEREDGLYFSKIAVRLSRTGVLLGFSSDIKLNADVVCYFVLSAQERNKS
jgi:hypothetical protein